MNLSLITVNYNNAQATGRLMASLRAQSNRNFTLIVVDNASSASDRIELANIAGNDAELIWSDVNGGFAAGSNLGIKRALAAGAEWVVLINNDALVGPDTLAALTHQLTGMQPAVVALPLLEHGETVRVGAVKWLSPTLSHICRQPRSDEHTYAIGGGVAIHRDVVERIGLLDERYFLYFEDADYSERARAAGIPVRIADIPAVSHEVSATTSKLGSPRLLRLHYRNALLFNWRNGPLWAKLAVPFWAIVLLAWHSVKAAFHPLLHEQSKAIIDGVIDFLCRRWGKTERVRIGIECEQIEDAAWGIGRTVHELLAELARRPEFGDHYHVHLYFKKRVPDLPFLSSPLFTTHVVWQPLPHKSFVFYYYVFLPIRLWFTRLDAMFYPNYMLPIIHPPWISSLTLMTDDIWYEMRSPQQRPHHRLAYWVFGYWAAWFATRILAISDASARELVRLFGIAPKRIKVAHLATDPARQKISSASPHLFSYILYVAQAFPRRHLRETVLAFEKLAMEFPGLMLVAIGPDRYHPPLAFANERIIRKDHVSDDELVALYAHARVFVYVSDREAFGLPPLEALSYGVPSVLADKAISRELFGDSAFYVENPDSADNIAAALRDALKNDAKREAIRTAAPGILARFTWQRFTDQWLDSIQAIAKPKNN